LKNFVENNYIFLIVKKKSKHKKGLGNAHPGPTWNFWWQLNLSVELVN
jgi:hypothetical protein